MKQIKINKEKVERTFYLLFVNVVVWYIFLTIAPAHIGAYVFGTSTLESPKHPQIEVLAAEPTIELSMEDWVKIEASSRGLKWEEVWSLIQCESSWTPDAINVNTNGSYDLGLWQWNSIHTHLTTECKLDYQCATNEAFNKRIKEGNWSAWVCADILGI